jgi:tetratricopeptide (TPR) repeat protein
MKIPWAKRKLQPGDSPPLVPDFRTTNVDWPVFISYRRGPVTEAIADWLERNLHEQVINTRTNQLAKLDVYLDRRRPVQMDFSPDLQQYLEQSRALLFILDESGCERKKSDVSGPPIEDNLYRELDWWRNRGRVPIILDTDRAVGKSFVKQTDFALWKNVPFVGCYWLDWEKDGPAKADESKRAKLAEIKDKIRDLGIFRELEERKKLRRRLRIAQAATILAILAAALAFYYLHDSRRTAANFNGARHGAETILSGLDEKVFTNRAAMGNIEMLEPLTDGAVAYFRTLPKSVMDHGTQQNFIEALLNQAEVYNSKKRFEEARSLIAEARRLLQPRDTSQDNFLLPMLRKLSEVLRGLVRELFDVPQSEIDPNDFDQVQILRATLLESSGYFLEGKFLDTLRVLRSTGDLIAAEPESLLSSQRPQLRAVKAMCLYELTVAEALAGNTENTSKYRSLAEKLDPNLHENAGSILPSPYLKDFEQAAVIAELFLSDPHSAAQRLEQDISGPANSAQASLNADLLIKLAPLQDLAGEWQKAMQSCERAESILRGLLTKEPNNVQLHERLLEAILGLFDAGLDHESPAESAAVLESIEAYSRDNASNISPERARTLKFEVLGDWGYLAEHHEDVQFRTRVRDKLLQVLTLRDGSPIPNPTTNPDWKIANLRIILVRLLDCPGDEAGCLRHLDADRQLWDEMFIGDVPRQTVAANPTILTRFQTAAAYSRVRGLCQEQQDPNDALLWLKRAAAISEQAFAANIQPAKNYMYRRDFAELEGYIADIYFTLKDFAKMRTEASAGLKTVKEGIGEDRTALITTAKLNNLFAISDFILSWNKTPAVLTSFVEAKNAVDRLRTSSASDPAAALEIARFDKIVATLKK